ncbi:MAG: GNAT family protein [Actinomycetaceae bacterium]|nr:GNAT family protein [Actinomycetaceae bacterium]
MEISLRWWQKTDGLRLFELYHLHPDLHRQLPQLAEPAQATELVTQWAALAEDEAIFCVSADGQPAGLIGFFYSGKDAESGRYDRAWVWYWSAAPIRGQGILKRLVKEGCDWAQGKDLAESAPQFLRQLPSPQIRRLELGYRLNNPASAKVAQYAGFLVEGVERAKFIIDGQPVDAAIAARL